jgi:hypothetical protein
MATTLFRFLSLLLEKPDFVAEVDLRGSPYTWHGAPEFPTAFDASEGGRKRFSPFWYPSMQLH